jgi:hypothetical protein
VGSVAEVIRLQTNYEVGPDVDVCQLVHTEQQRLLLVETGLARARPDALGRRRKREHLRDGRRPLAHRGG